MQINIAYMLIFPEKQSTARSFLRLFKQGDQVSIKVASNQSSEGEGR